MQSENINIVVCDTLYIHDFKIWYNNKQVLAY